MLSKIIETHMNLVFVGRELDDLRGSLRKLLKKVDPENCNSEWYAVRCLIGCLGDVNGREGKL